jgi:peptidoglycan/LPS O-acetylase OafA/YrhL
MTQPAFAPRLRGLDLLRAAAILLVLMSHYMGFVSHAPTFGVVGKVGWAGVDLFFVLSGYLIGNQLLAPAARGEPLSLKAFFVRRLLRTLPNYYVVLAVYWLFPGPPLGGSSMAEPWRFLTFTQNFGLAYGQTFTHSWSLCIEEQFYVLLPLVVLALARIGFPVRLAWGLLVGGIVAGMATRAAAYALNGHDAFSAEVYYSSFCRADELLPGVAIALLRNFHPHAFARLLRHANLLCAVGLAASVGILTCIHLDWPTTSVTSTFGFSLLAIGFALLTCAALSARRSSRCGRTPSTSCTSPCSWRCDRTWSGCTSMPARPRPSSQSWARASPAAGCCTAAWRRRSCGCGHGGRPLIPRIKHSIARPAHRDPGGSTVASSPP